MCHWRKFSIPYSLSWLLFFFASFTQWHHRPSPFFFITTSEFHCPLPPLPLISTVHSLWFPLSTPSDDPSLFFLIPGFNHSLIKSYTPFPRYSPFSLTSKSNNEWAHLCTFSNTENHTTGQSHGHQSELREVHPFPFSVFSPLVRTNSFKCLLPASGLPSHYFYP